MRTFFIFLLGVENSFPNPVVRKRFYKKYYQLLLHGKFPMKETKLCIVGPPDSGKTSWFSPFQGKLILKDPNLSLDLFLCSFFVDFSVDEIT